VAPEQTAAVERTRRGIAAFGWAVAGFAAACLLCAIVLALYAAAAADPPQCLADTCRGVGRATTALGWGIAVGALVVAAAPVLGWRLLAGVRRVPTRLVRLLAALCAAGIVAACLAVGLVSDDFPASGQRVWLIRGAAAFAVAGCLAVAAVPRPARRDVNRSAVLAVIVVVIVVAGSAVTVWRDERSAVDATTAARVDVPAVPARLGPQRFSLTLPYYKPVFESAGAGFVVWSQHWSGDPSAPDLVAFDAAGRERWHYSRADRDPWSIARMRVYDAGAVIVLGLSDAAGDHRVLGLDAVTGTRLWTSTDPDLWAVLDADDGGSLRFPVLRGDDQWTGFDARTGGQAWRIPNPAGCGPGPLKSLSSVDHPYPVRPVDTPTQLVTVVDCSTVDTVRVRVVVTDPATGNRVAERPVTPIDGQPRSTLNYLGIEQADADTVGLRLTPQDPQQGATIRFNWTTGQTTDYPDDWLYPSQQPRGDFLVLSESTGDRDLFFPPGARDVTARLLNADQTPRCQFDRRSRGDWPPRWLTDQLVLLEFNPQTMNREIRVIDRDDCHTESQEPVPLALSDTADLTALRPVAGAVLLLRWHDAATVDVVGYGP
jgi:outer membrane protein assembly factor BamB